MVTLNENAPDELASPPAISRFFPLPIISTVTYSPGLNPAPHMVVLPPDATACDARLEDTEVVSIQETTITGALASEPLPPSANTVVIPVSTLIPSLKSTANAPALFAAT